MRIALVHPTYWPEVRRGSERLIHDLGVSLASRGHEVTLLTSHRGRPSVEHEDGIDVVRRWRPPERTPLSWYEHHVANVPAIVWQLWRGGYDLAHAFFPVDGWAAVKARRLGGPPVIFSFHGIPAREHLVRRRYRLELVETLAREADTVSALSEAAAERFRAYFGRSPLILPGGVRAADFAAELPRTPEPTLICTASLGDPRKRAGVLFDAFERLRRQRPGVRLRVAATPDPVMSGDAPELPDGAEWFEGDDTGELAGALAEAWVAVLPSIEEAFGLVLIESLAAGTPVVAARSGACPEIVDREPIGRLFEPDDPSSLARCLDEALDLADDPATAAACRRRAGDFDWDRVVELYEDAYASLPDRSRQRRGVGHA